MKFVKNLSRKLIFTTLILTLSLLSKNCRNNELKLSDGDPSSPSGFLISWMLQNAYNDIIKTKMAISSIYGVYVDQTRILVAANKASVFESTDGVTFKKYSYSSVYSTKLGTCLIPSLGLDDQCNIIGVGFENNNYYLIGQVSNVSYNNNTATVSKNKFYYLKTPTLGSGTFVEILSGTSEYQSPSFIVKNSILHLGLEGTYPASKLFFSTDGSTWTNSGLTNPQCSSGRLYYDGTRVLCNTTGYFTGTAWQSSTHTGVAGVSAAGYVNSKYIGAWSGGIYELTSGAITGGTFTQRQALSNIGEPVYSPVYNSTIGKYLIIFPAQTTSDPLSLTAYTSTNASTWTGTATTGLSVTSVKAVYSFGNYFYLLGTKSGANYTTAIHLYQSSDGITWTKLSNTGLE